MAIFPCAVQKNKLIEALGDKVEDIVKVEKKRTE